MGKITSILPDSVRTADGIVKSLLIAVPMTRKWAVEMQVKQLVALNKFTDIEMHILFYIDNEDLKASYVTDRCEYYELTVPYTVHNTKNRAPHEIRLYHRRDRIRDMLTSMQKFITDMPQDFDMMFMIEDDTEVASDTLERLLVDYKTLCEQDMKIGLIQGVQVGRHGIRMIGAWKCDNIHQPTKMATLPLNKSSLFQKIDGGGLFCFITPMELFLAHKFYWHDECFSVDVTYGLELRKAGYTNVIDWSVITGHVDQHGNNFKPNGNTTVASYEKKDDGKWQLVNNQRKGATS